VSAFLNWSVFGTQKLAEFLLGPVRELVIGYLIGKSWVSFVLLNGFVSESELSKSELVLLYGGVVLVELSHPVNELELDFADSGSMGNQSGGGEGLH